jgi:acyl-CoA reductase-like NAD-dependent aldehyde dehydrogenase
MDEMGAPWSLARDAQAASGTQHIKAALKALEHYEFEERIRTTNVVKEPIGVCGLITPWNWPMNQIAVKVAPALAAGCTMVLKPSEIAPFDAIVFAEVLDAAGVPAGVFPWCRKCTVRPPGHRHGVIHRLDSRRRPGGAKCCADRETCRSGTWRQVCKYYR